MNIYAVFWKDAVHALHPDKENTELASGADIGFVLQVEDDRIILGRQFFDDGVARHGMTIPSCQISDIKFIGVLELPAEFDREPILE